MLATAAWVSAVLCAAPLKLATVGFTQVGLSDAQAAFYAEHFSTRLAEEREVRITTPKDMAALLGVEKQKQLLGCSDQSSSCMAELAGALGADGLITGQVAKVGKRFQLNLKVLAGDGSRTLYVHSSKLLASEEDLIDELNEVAADAIRSVREQLGVPQSAPVETPTASSSRSGHSWWKLLPSLAGAVLIGVSAFAFNTASQDYHHLDKSGWATLEVAGAQAAVHDGEQSLTIGIIMASVGVVALAAGLLWFLLSGGS